MSVVTQSVITSGVVQLGLVSGAIYTPSARSSYYLKFNESGCVFDSRIDMLNPDNITTNGVIIEFTATLNTDDSGTILSQNIASTNGLREFSLYLASTGEVWVYLGGAGTIVLSGVDDTEPCDYVFNIQPDLTFTCTNNGTPVNSGTLTAGGVREPTAIATVAMRTDDELGSYAYHYNNVIGNVKIYTEDGDEAADVKIDEYGSDTQTNDVDSSNSLTLVGVNHSTDWYEYYSGYYLGYERITQDVWVTPHTQQDQWSFTDDQWSLNGDGAFNVLQLLTGSEQPSNYLLKGNCSSISGSLAVEATTSCVISEAGVYEFVLDNDVVSAQLYKRAEGSVTATLDKPSMREVLNP